MISKKTTFITAFSLFLVSGILSYLYFSGFLAGKGLPMLKKEGANITEGPKTEECPMNGQFYTEGQREKWEKRRPLGVMIENHTEARPQSGLSNANIIYEAVAEGGITRFLAIYYCEDAPLVGPVRSARIYYVKLLQEYGAYPLYAHVGGANTPGPADALGEIRDLNWDQYSDLNQFAVPFPYYYRDYDRLPNVATEHTMYAVTEKLWEFAKSQRKLTNVDAKGRAWDETFTPWKFKDDAKKESRGDVDTVSLNFWERFKDFAVVWNYDTNSNSYVRENGGGPHIDKNTGKPLTTKNVVVIFADESPANDGYPGGHLLYDVVGQGEGVIFQNGDAIEVTWRKSEEESRMKFFDESGDELSFVRGKVFIEVLPTGNEVTY